MSVDRRAINVLLAGLDIEQRDLAEAMGYCPGYVANVLNGLTPVSKAFRAAFGQVLAELLLGPEDPGPRRYPAGPLAEMVRRRAEQVARKTDLYSDLGVSPHTLANRELLPEELVDRVCCALGVHPTSVYGLDSGSDGLALSRPTNTSFGSPGEGEGGCAPHSSQRRAASSPEEKA